jgi:Lrp/AsnC family transcriptional regulator, leucine-responsive regulatory protein
MVEKSRDIDQFDEKLLRTLERNARATSFELAAVVGLSPSSCQRRQRELEQRGIVQGYRAEIDPAVLGQAFTVFAALQLQRHERSEVQAFQRPLSCCPKCWKCIISRAPSTICCGSRSRTSVLTKSSMLIA